jgi:hypothetical protein
MASLEEQLAEYKAAIAKQIPVGLASATTPQGTSAAETPTSTATNLNEAAKSLNRNLYKAEEQLLFENFPSPYAWVTPLRQMEQRKGEGNQASAKGINPVHYGHMTVFQDKESKSGIYMSSAPDETFVALEHGNSASYMEIQDNGDTVQQIYGNGYRIVTKNEHVLIEGFCVIKVVGNCQLEIEGDKIEHIKGDYKLRVDGNFDVTATRGYMLTTAEDVDIYVHGVTSALTLHAPNVPALTPGIFLNGSALVEGSLDASSVSSAGAVTAKLSLFVGPAGIVCVGGALIGFTLGVPVPGFLTASLQVSAPMIKDVGGYLLTLRGLYNSHNHMAGRLTTQTLMPDLAGAALAPASLGSMAGGQMTSFS